MRALKSDVQKKNTREQKRAISLPQWLDCTWRRVPCNKKQCPVCSLLTAEEQKLIARGEGEEFVCDVLDDLRYSIAESFLSVVDSSARGHRTAAHERRAFAKRSPRRFPLYRTLDRWHEELHDLFSDGDDAESFWVQTADAADVDWYMHILLDFTHRQLLYLEKNSAQALRSSVPVAYTRYVIDATAQLVAEGLNRLALLDSTEKGVLILMAGTFSRIRPALVRI